METENLKLALADEAFISDPYKLYDKLRARGPLHSMDRGVWLIVGYNAAVNALLDARLSNRPALFALLHERNHATFVGADVARNLIAFQDPPQPVQPRRLMATELNALIKTRWKLLDDLAAELVAGMKPGDFDFIEAVAAPYALRAMCLIFGLPETDLLQLKIWSEAFFYLFQPISDRGTLLKMNAKIGAFRAYLASAIEERRISPRDDLLSMLCGADPKTLDGTVLVDNAMLLVSDAIENVRAGIGNAVLLLIKHSLAIEDFLNEGGTWVAVVDETLRLESPGQYQGRIALEPIEIGGTVLPKHSVVFVGLAAANRDPAVFEDPDQFRLGRKGPRHLAFGLGSHACIGSNLVRMETAKILEALRRLVPSLELSEKRMEWEIRAGHRWLKKLPLVLKEEHGSDAKIV